MADYITPQKQNPHIQKGVQDCKLETHLPIETH